MTTEKLYLFIDTETTGLPANWKAPYTDSNNWPRMVQIAWQLLDKNQNLLDQADFIVQPEGYTIPADASRVHKITTERAQQEGEYLNKILTTLNAMLDKSTHVVAHNMSFDHSIIGAEYHRKKMPTSLHSKNRVCTMQSSTDFCKLPGKYDYKYPNLNELHIILFKESFKDAHNAAADINATVKCFFELQKRGLRIG